MASSLVSIAETWPENVLPPIGSRKSHCVRKIKLVRNLIYLGPDGFSAHLRNFLQVLDLHIFRQKQPGHWAEVVCHFHLLFHDAKLRKRNLALSSFVQLCPFMSSYDIASLFIYVAKLRNRNLAMSKFVQFCPLNF